MVAANASDFFGEGIYDDPEAQKAKRDWTANPPQTNAELQQYLQQVQGDLYTAPGTDSTPGSSEERAVNAYQGGNFGATAGYAAGNDATRAAYGKAHATTQAVGIGRLPGEIANYFGNAQVNLNPFDGAPQNVKDAANAQLATDAYAHRNDPVPTNPATVIGADVVPTGPGVPAPPAPAPDPTAPAATAPTLDRTPIDEALGGLDAYQGALWELSQDNTGLSAAEAQLKKATDLARIQSGIATEASQRAALGQARSSRNRGDRALAERQAIGEAGYIGQDQARTDQLREAETEGQLATLRATEADSDRRFKLDAIKEAAGLGLNTAALELDISKTNLGSVTNQINNQFQLAGIKMQVDQRQAEAMLNFSRDMAIIQQKYDQMGVDAQIETEKLLMQRYQIDQDTMVKLKDLKGRTGLNWSSILMTFAGGAGKGATAALFASDRRVKKDIRPVLDEELDELLTALKGETYDYVDDERFGGGRHGRRFSFMAQDLEKTKLGKAMVKPYDDQGTKGVDTGAVAMATAGGLAVVYERLKGLEEAIK
jgi:hypothetical protein